MYTGTFPKETRCDGNVKPEEVESETILHEEDLFQEAEQNAHEEFYARQRKMYTAARWRADTILEKREERPG
jgi:hypothetical protein